MSKISETEKDTLQKKQIIHERFKVTEWLMNTESARIYIGEIKFRLIFNVTGVDLLSQEDILIKFVRK